MDKSASFQRGLERLGLVSEEVTEETIETKVEEIQVKEEATMPFDIEELDADTTEDDQSEEE